jgi:hypothetical protein
MLVFLRSMYRLLVTVSVVPNSPIHVTLMKEVLSSSEMSVLQEPHGVTSQKTPFFISLQDYTGPQCSRPQSAQRYCPLSFPNSLTATCCMEYSTLMKWPSDNLHCMWKPVVTCNLSCKCHTNWLTTKLSIQCWWFLERYSKPVFIHWGGDTHSLPCSCALYLCPLPNFN